MESRVAVHLVLIFSFIIFGTLSFLQSITTKAPDYDYESVLSPYVRAPKPAEKNMIAEADSETKLIAPVPVTKVELKVLRACRGSLYQNQNELHHRTILFLTTDLGTPEIITAKVFNQTDSDFDNEISTIAFNDPHQNTLKRSGVFAVHGNLSALRAQDEKSNQNQYRNLIHEMAQLCSADESVSDFDADQFFADIDETQAAFVQLDAKLEDPNTKVTIFYQVNGQIFSFEWSPTPKSI